MWHLCHDHGVAQEPEDTGQVVAMGSDLAAPLAGTPWRSDAAYGLYTGIGGLDLRVGGCGQGILVVAGCSTLNIGGEL